ncbi:MAG: metallophosphoesterase [Acidianus hospitalis]
MGLFSFGKKSNTHGNQLKILFTSDLHGSNVAFKKFLNAGKMYKVDVLIVGGDLAGKALIPIVDLGNGKFDVQGETVGKEGLQEVENSLANKGIYYAIMDKKEFEEIQDDKRKQDEIFKQAMIERVREWVKIADERLKDLGIPLYVNLGNDDPEYLFEVLKESEVIKITEGEVVDFKGYEMLTYGYVNPTPWNTPREKKEEELYKELKSYVEKANPERAIFNFHAPPYGTNLDNAPLLDKTLKPVVKGGEIVFTHVGSTSIRKLMEEFNPLLGLHGHIHESRAFDKIGKTIVLNPGSEFSEGILHAAYVVLEDGRVKAHQFIIG